VDVFNPLQDLPVGEGLVGEVGAEAPDPVSGAFVDNLAEQLPVDHPFGLLGIGNAVVAENAVGVATGLRFELDGPGKVRDRTPEQSVPQSPQERRAGIGEVVLVDLEAQAKLPVVFRCE
jgi:hypothetical protein